VKKDDIAILSIEDGIRIARMKFSQCYFDQQNVFGNHVTVTPDGQTELTHRLGECLKRYRRKVNNELVATTPVHDSFSHGADCFRYVAVNADSMRNESDKKVFVPNPGYVPLDTAVNY
jgi:phage terminase large subunit